MAENLSPEKLIDLGAACKGPLARRFYNLVERPCEKILSVETFNGYYRRVVEEFDSVNFFNTALKVFHVEFIVSEEDLNKIPTSGPLFAVANHPFGGIDGLILGALLTSVRPDTKLLANYLLERMPEIRPWLIPINPFGGKKALRNNFGPLKDCLKWLRKGGAIGTFPSGYVSYFRVREREISDPEWNINTAAFVRRSEASVLPVYFEGRNSPFFQLAGMVHPRLRTVFLPREMVKKARARIRIRIGRAIPHRQLARFQSDREMVDFLRLKTYLLRGRKGPEKSSSRTFPRRSGKRTVSPPLAPPIPPMVLEEEVDRLPEGQCLARRNDFAIYYADSAQIPEILKEIGRLREKTFRAVGENFGEFKTLDRCDAYYRQLFMWNRKSLEIVGGYRLGAVKPILEKWGKEGLFTSRLFNFKTELLESLDCALELGRSFIRPEYQRKHASLALIWRGIGEYIARNPCYPILFGPVSISKEYTTLSRNLIVQFLTEKRLHPELSSFVKGKNPPRINRLGKFTSQTLRSPVLDINDISSLISEIEADKKGVPVLLRHYLKLNGVILSFNVDTDFSEVLDSLIFVDLRKTDPQLLSRYMGRDNYEKFMRFHGLGPVLQRPARKGFGDYQRARGEEERRDTQPEIGADWLKGRRT